MESEIARLSEEHITIRTQYRLLPISGAGFLLSDLQRYLPPGTHLWEAEPAEDEDEAYIAGMDVGGEDRPKPGDESKPTGKRESTVIPIGRVRYNELDLPRIEVVHQVWWTGMRYLDPYAATVAVVQQWNIRQLVIDRTRLGEVSFDLINGSALGMRNEMPHASEVALSRSSLHSWLLHKDGTVPPLLACKRCDRDGLSSRCTLHSWLPLISLRIPWEKGILARLQDATRLRTHRSDQSTS